MKAEYLAVFQKGIMILLKCQNCVNLGHVSKIKGGGRHTYMINGQLNLVKRCISFDGHHEIVTQDKTAGAEPRPASITALPIEEKNLHNIGLWFLIGGRAKTSESY